MRKARCVLGWALIVLLLVGCQPVVHVRLLSSTDLTATALVNSQAAVTTHASNRPTPAASAQPTATPAFSVGLATPTPTEGASATTAPAAVRLRFAAGATSAVAQGHLEPGESRQYVLLAEAGQILGVWVASDVPLGLAIRGADGTLLKPSSDGALSWQGTLPSGQDYTLELSGADRATDYGLRATAFARIQLKAGETSATVSGTVERLGAEGVEFAGGYVVGALAGQTLRATLSSAHGTVLLDITGADGSPLVRYVSGNTEWEGVLPLTQDYLIRPASVGGDTRFTLTLWFSPVSTP